jgi:hypothetical protein
MKGKVCGAKLRGKNTYCQKPPMANGRCKLHGGKTPSGPDSPHFKHGRYADAFKGTMAQRFAKLQEDATPLDAISDLNVQRTMLATYIETAGAKKTVRLSDLVNAADMAKDAVKSAAIIAQTRQKDALTLAELKFLQKGMMILMEKYVPDPNNRRNFIADLYALIPQTDGAETDEPAELPAGAGTTSETS